MSSTSNCPLMFLAFSLVTHSCRLVTVTNLTDFWRYWPRVCWHSCPCRRAKSGPAHGLVLRSLTGRLEWPNLRTTERVRYNLNVILRNMAKLGAATWHNHAFDKRSNVFTLSSSDLIGLVDLYAGTLFKATKVKLTIQQFASHLIVFSNSTSLNTVLIVEVFFFYLGDSCVDWVHVQPYTGALTTNHHGSVAVLIWDCFFLTHIVVMNTPGSSTEGVVSW